MKRRYYDLQNTEASKFYRGCGYGLLYVNKETDKPYKMVYGIENASDEQNVEMCDRAGEIYDETKDYIAYVANYSCYQACLF